MLQLHQEPNYASSYAQLKDLRSREEPLKKLLQRWEKDDRELLYDSILWNKERILNYEEILFIKRNIARREEIIDKEELFFT